MKAKRLMDCKKAQILIAPHILGDLENDPLRCGQLEAHLKDCPECTEMYEGFQATIGFVLEHRAEFAQAFKKAREMEQENAVTVKFVESLEKPSNISIGLLVKISAIAACLIIGFGLFFTASQFKSPSNRSLPAVSSQQQNSVKIELISGGTTEIIPVGQPIIATNELKTLRINSNRQMVLNVGTELSIEPYDLGCLVKLDHGEIYTDVEHDGKPFVVETVHGRAVITGTTFNIKADHEKMDLTVVEGSVHFESEDGTVDVIGGYQSSIATSMQPTKPVACNTLRIVEWAKGQKSTKMIQVEPPDIYFSEMLDLSITFIPYCDLEDIDFEVWINQRREWFEREFPWTKRMQKLLAQDGVEVDTIDLLIESGDLWRFAWPEYSQQRILAEDQGVIQKVAGRYAVEADHLMLATSLASTKKDVAIEAFERWQDAFEKESNNGASIIQSIHATTYLIKTRSLLWFAIQNKQIQVQNRTLVLQRLAEQVKTGTVFIEMLKEFLLVQDESICSVSIHEQKMKIIAQHIILMNDNEKYFNRYHLQP